MKLIIREENNVVYVVDHIEKVRLTLCNEPRKDKSTIAIHFTSGEISYEVYKTHCEAISAYMDIITHLEG